MVLGIRSKSKKTVSIQVHYIIHVHEIRPWPPSKSLRSAQSVVLQWENGDKISGSFACSSRDGKIEINESFRLPLLLLRESSKRGKHQDTFQKNFLDFYLYEHQNDKAKSQLLGSATINIADYGVIKEITAINTQVNCKKSFRNSTHPFLYINIQPFDVEGSDSSPKSSMSKELSLDKEESESATQSLNDEDVEIAAFTDDEINDISSNTSQAVKSASETTGGLPPLDKVEIRKVGTMGSTSESIEPMETSSAGSHTETETGASLHSSSLVLSPDTSNTTCDGTSLPTFPADHVKFANSRSKVLESANPDIQAEAGSSKKFNGIKLPSPSVTLSSDTGNATYDRPPPKFSEEHIKVSDVSSSVPNFSSSLIKEVGASEKSNGIKLPSLSMVLSLNSSNAIYDSYSSPKFPAECVKDADASCKIPESTQQTSRKNISKGAMVKSLSSASYIMQSSIKNSSRSQDKELLHNPSEDDYPRNGKIAGATRPLSREAHEQPRNVVINDKPEDLTSLKLPLDISKNYGLFGNNQAPEKEEENNTLNGDHVDAACHEGSNTNDSLNNIETELKSEVQMLREELREAAALEIALYSVVADHGSSANKVHAPARRISRFYIHAFRVGSPAARASAAQSAVSGFVLVSKACGNDVPRLTFWLSNLILLRAIVSKGVEKIRLDDSLCINSDRNGSVNGSSQKRSPSSSDGKRENAVKHFHSWEDPQTFLFALEKIEAWIFLRIVESLWWQTLTPHMQSTVAKSSISRKAYGRRHGLGDQEQGNFSIDLWKRSFKDACERLCPLRAGGHGCGCLPMIARLVMEQLVIRLDVAMFNAILRESAEEMPTDPISDPISDSRVLPIPAGKSGFGAGAQLKNAIGNWSRWLSDLFDIDYSDSPEDQNEDDRNGSPECETSFKAFHLLHSLSDLMMLPFEMLADNSQRKEVCPAFGVPLIRRVLNNFVPDEFCPGPIPDAILETLNTEDIQDDEGCISSIPHVAAPTSYAPPPATSVTGIVQEMGTQSLRRSGSSMVKKSYTSDDELDDLDSPLSAIGIDEPSLVSNKFPTVKEGRNFVRYELLREVWRDSE